MIRVFVNDEAAKARVATVRAYAEQKEHWYVVGDDTARVPGHCAEYTAEFLFGIRAVFSISCLSDRLPCRHLTVGIDSPGLPNPAIVKEVATLFGFTGEPGADYLCAPSEGEHCIVCVQGFNEARTDLQ